MKPGDVGKIVSDRGHRDPFICAHCKEKTPASEGQTVEVKDDYGVRMRRSFCDACLQTHFSGADA